MVKKQRLMSSRRVIAVILSIAMILTGGGLPFANCAPANSYAEETQGTKIKEVKIVGEPTVGQILTAEVAGEDGSEPANLTYQWQYEDKTYDDLTGETDTDYVSIEGEIQKTLLLTDAMEKKDIVVAVKGAGDKNATISKSVKVKQKQLSDGEKYLRGIVEKIPAVHSPVYGSDTNILTFFKGKLDEKHGSESEYAGVELSLVSSDKPEVVENDGTIHYFYKDISQVNAPGFNNTYWQAELTFKLTKGRDSVTFNRKANIHWDIEKLKADLTKYVLDEFTEQYMLNGKNTSLSDIQNEWSRPKQLPAKSYATIKYETDKPNVLKIEKQKYGTNYVFKPQKIKEDTSAKLYVKIEQYRFTNYGTKESEEIQKLEKEFNLTVKGQAAAIAKEKEEAQAAFDKNYAFTNKGMQYFATKTPVDPEHVTGDIVLPMPRELGIKNYDEYKAPITVEVSDKKYVKINAYRANIIRPLHGEPAKEVELTVKMVKKDDPEFVLSKKLKITIDPLGENDLSDAKKLIEKVKASYFDGIKGENTDKNDITKNFHTFREGYFDSEGNLKWSYAYRDDKNIGIKPVQFKDYNPMGAANQARTFRSSKPAIISHELLRFLKKPEYDTEVKIESELSAIPFENYLETYPDNEDIKAILNQPVSAVVKVKGTKGENPGTTTPVSKAKVQFRLYDGQSISFMPPFGEFEVSAGTAKAYGYSDSEIDSFAEEGKVTMLDVLVAYTAKKFDIPDPKTPGAKEKIKQQLDVANGWVKKVNGLDTQTHPFSYFLNDVMPSDGVLNPQYGEYTGTLLNNTQIKENDKTVFFFYQKTDYSDYYTWFENSQKIDKISIPQGEETELVLKGFETKYALKPKDVIVKNTKPIKNIQIFLVDKSTGAMTALPGKKTDASGKVSVSFDSTGDYILTAAGNNDIGIVAPKLDVKVTTSTSSDAEKQKIVQQDADALSFDDIKGGNADANNVIGDLKLIKKGKSGKTAITWKSSNSSVVRANTYVQDGKVTRPVMPKGDEAVELTATVEYGGKSATKKIQVTVKAINKDKQDLNKLLEIVDNGGVDFALKEWNKNNREKKMDTNVITVLKNRLKFKTERKDDLKVGTECKSEDETVIKNDGTIIYGNKQKTVDVEFVITIGTESARRVLSVTVPEREITKEEALKGDWLDFNYIKKKNDSAEHVVSDLEYTEYDDKYAVRFDWESSNEDVIRIDKFAKTVKVTRPAAGSQDANVTLTIKIKKNTYKWNTKKFAGSEPSFSEGVRTFNLVVKAEPGAGISENQELVNDAIKIVDLKFVKNILTKENMALDNITYDFDTAIATMKDLKNVQGYRDSFANIKVEWSTTNPSVQKGVVAFKVKRGSEDKTGELKVTLTYKDGKAEKSFPITVKAWTQAEITEKADAANKAVKKIADSLTFDTIRGENLHEQDIFEPLKWIKSGIIKDDKVEFRVRQASHEQGANIAWKISDENVLHTEGMNIKIKNQPEKNTKVVLTAELTSVMDSELAGVNKLTKTFEIVVRGSNDTPIEKPDSGKAEVDAAKALANTIAKGYLQKDLSWWSGQDRFWKVAAVSAYLKDIDAASGTISKEQKQAVCDKVIKDKIEKVTLDPKKASQEAGLLLHAINILSALGYDPTEVITSKGDKVNAVALLEKIKLEDAKKGWFSTIAPYVMIGFNQTEFKNEALKKEYIDYMLGELQKEDSYKWGVDTPAMIMQGLVPYYGSNTAVKEQVDKAFEKLAAKQGTNGSFGNANSDAMMLITLAQYGINPQKDTRFTKGGHNVLEGILQYATSKKDGFKYGARDVVNDMATEQGILALISAIKVVETGKAYNVYDFSKIAKQKGASVQMPADNVELKTVVVLPEDLELKPDANGEYSHKLKADVQNVKIKAVPMNTGATVIVNGETLEKDGEWTSKFINVKNGENKNITIKVVSEDKTANKEYTFKLSREEQSAKPPKPDDTINVEFELGEYQEPDGKPSSKAWIGRKTVNIPKGSTVKYVTDKELASAGLDFKLKSNGTYISGIQKPNSNEYLSEFDKGRNSGWMYRHNGKIANEGYASRVLKDKDVVVWFYTPDYKLEKGYEGNWDHVNSSSSKTDNKVEVNKTDAGNNAISANVETAATVDVKTGTATAKVSADTVKDKIAEIDKKAEQAKKDGKAVAEKKLTINVKADKSAKAVEAALPKEAFAQMNAKVDSLVIATDVAETKLDRAAIKDLAAKVKADISIKIAKNDVDASVMNKADGNLKTQIANRPMFEISAKNGNENITNISGKVEITVPYQKSASEEEEAVIVYSVSEDGSLVIVPKANLDNGKIELENGQLNTKFVIAYNPKQFADSENHWANKNVKFLAARGILNGKSEASFDPNGQVSRAEFVQILAKLSDEEFAKSGGNTFADVDAGSWYSNAVMWASASGIVTGMGEGKFMPNESISRQDMAVIIERYLKHRGETLKEKNKEANFTDASSVASYAKDAVDKMQKAGIINGASDVKGGVSFNPNSQASRAEAATMIVRYIKM